jgi:hypothetical protein
MKTLLSNQQTKAVLLLSSLYLLGTKVFLDPKASSEIIKFLRQFGLVDGTRNWTEIETP